MKKGPAPPLRYRLPRLSGSAKTMAMLLSMTLFSACSGLSYYSQSISGQLAILAKKQSIDLVIKDEQTPEGIRQKLRLVEKIRDFAEQELLLPANGSYEEYSDLARPYVVWNVFAAPEFSLEPVRWCYLILGCLAYRGYFDKARAQQFAAALQAKGMDVYTGGVRAFSTLGWLHDPVMNTMLDRADHELARLLFHELAHQKLYVKDDTAFNEAFADAIAIIGTERWMKTQGEARPAFALELKRERQFVGLVLQYREKLAGLYASKIPDQAKRSKKSAIIMELRAACRDLRSAWGDYDAFDSWIHGPLNNARLSALSSYQYFVPDFLAIYSKTGNDLHAFYAIIRQLAACEQPTRHRLLQQQATSIPC